MTARSLSRPSGPSAGAEPARSVPCSRPVPRTCRQRLGVAMLSCGLLLFAGCGPSGPKLVPVKGTVFLDGQPLAYKSLLFLPEDGTAGNGAGGYTNGKGEYALIAVIFGATSDRQGCPPGRYRVVISEPTIPITEADFGHLNVQAEGDEPAVAIGPQSAPANSNRQIPVAYTSEQTTPLVLEVPESGGVLDVKLASKSS